jgi:hypothetical protein
MPLLADLTKEAENIEGVSNNPMNPMSVNMLAAYLPKNLNSIFLRKVVASRQSNDGNNFQRLPANVALALICSYLASWNSASTDHRFFEEVIN